jgi:hypothetical protein
VAAEDQVGKEEGWDRDVVVVVAIVKSEDGTADHSLHSDTIAVEVDNPGPVAEELWEPPIAAAGLPEEIVDRRLGIVVAVEGPTENWDSQDKDFGAVAEAVVEHSLAVGMDYSVDRRYLVEKSYLPRLESEQNLRRKYTAADLVRRPEQAPLETAVGNSSHIHHQPEETPPPEDSHLNWEDIPSAADLAADTCQPVSADRAAKLWQKTLVGWCWW